MGRFGIAFLLLAVIGLAWSLGLHELLDLDVLRARQAALAVRIEANPVAAAGPK